MDKGMAFLIFYTKEKGTLCYSREDCKKDPNLNGLTLHREDGPAMEYSFGTNVWYIDGEMHREEGPAMEYFNGEQDWYLGGERYSKKRHKKKVQEINKLPLSLQSTHEEQWVRDRARRRQEDEARRMSIFEYKFYLRALQSICRKIRRKF